MCEVNFCCCGFLSFFHVFFILFFLRCKRLILFFKIKVIPSTKIFLCGEVNFLLNFVLKTKLSKKLFIVEFCIKSRFSYVLFWSLAIKCDSKVLGLNFRHLLLFETTSLPWRFLSHINFLTRWRWISDWVVWIFWLVAAGFSFVEVHFHKLWSRVKLCHVGDLFLQSYVPCVMCSNLIPWGSLLKVSSIFHRQKAQLFIKFWMEVCI